MRYADGVDRRDMEQVRACFAPDLEVTGWGGGFPDRDSMITYISGVAIFHTTMHMFGNMYVRLDGDVAHADSYAMLIHRRDDDDGVTHEFDVPAARYVETLSRRDDRWLITKRGDEARWRTTPLPLARDAAPAVRWLVDRAVIRDVVLGRARATDERGDTS